MRVRIAHLSDIHVNLQPNPVRANLREKLQDVIRWHASPQSGSEDARFASELKEWFARLEDVFVAGDLEAAKRTVCSFTARLAAADRSGETDRKRRFLSWAAVVWLSCQPDRPESRIALCDDLVLRDIDHVIISGDLTTFALDAEFAEAAEFVKRIEAAGIGVTVAPGNHDVGRTAGDRLSLFTRYLGAYCPRLQAPGWLERDGVGIVSLDSTTCSRGDHDPFASDGDISLEQMDLLRRFFDQTRDGARIVVLHHHLRPTDSLVTGWNPLKNGDDLLSVCAASGDVLVLHGHEHEMRSYRLDGPRPSFVHCADASPQTCRYRVFTYENGRLTDPDPRPMALLPPRVLAPPREIQVTREPHDDLRTARKEAIMSDPHSSAERADSLKILFNKLWGDAIRDDPAGLLTYQAMADIASKIRLEGPTILQTPALPDEVETGMRFAEVLVEPSEIKIKELLVDLAKGALGLAGLAVAAYALTLFLSVGLVAEVTAVIFGGLAGGPLAWPLLVVAAGMIAASVYLFVQKTTPEERSTKAHRIVMESIDRWAKAQTE